MSAHFLADSGDGEVPYVPMAIAHAAGASAIGHDPVEALSHSLLGVAGLCLDEQGRSNASPRWELHNSWIVCSAVVPLTADLAQCCSCGRKRLQNYVEPLRKVSATAAILASPSSTTVVIKSSPLCCFLCDTAWITEGASPKASFGGSLKAIALGFPF